MHVTNLLFIIIIELLNLLCTAHFFLILGLIINKLDREYYVFRGSACLNDHNDSSNKTFERT